MKWTLIFLLGSSLAETALGWTYHYSNRPMNWSQARQWCQTYFTDMVVIQSQLENDFLVSRLPTRSKSPYFWIGITKNHKNEPWTWVGNNSTWIGNQSWAANEPNNNHSTEFCVEIYMNKGDNRGKWNDEKCANKKFPVCYKAQCNATLCGRGRCQETIENITCICEPGFEGDRCQTETTNQSAEDEANKLYISPATTAPNLTATETTNQSAEDEANKLYISPATTAPNLTATVTAKCNATSCGRGRCHETTGNITCLCEPGFKGDRCQTAVQCTPLSQPDNGHLSCSGGNQTFNSTCRFKCYSGFLMLGSPVVTCGVKGMWSGPRPVCSSYKQALLAVAGCGACSAFCCICFCWMKRRKRKKLAQVSQPEEVTSEAQG